MNLRKLYLLSLLFSLLLFSCQKEHLNGGEPDSVQTGVNNIADNGLDLTPFLHLDEERLTILKALEFPVHTRSIDMVRMSPESTEIPGLGQTRTFTLTCSNMAANVEVIVREIYDGEIARVTAANFGLTNKTAEIYFPPYYELGGTSRVYVLEYSENGGTAQSFGVLIQNPIDAHFITNLRLFNYTISRGGGIVTIYKDGSYPETIGEYIDFRFAINHNPDDYISAVVLANPSLEEIDISVPLNSGEARFLTLYYRCPYSDWVVLDQCMQLGAGGGGNTVTDWIVTRTLSNPLTVYGGTGLVGISGEYYGLNVRLWTTNSLGQELTTEVKTLNKGDFPPVDPNFDLTAFDGALSFDIPAFEDNGWPYSLDRRYWYNSGNSFAWFAQVDKGNGWEFLDANTHGSNQLPQPWNRLKLAEALDYAPREYSTWPVTVSGYWEHQTANRLVRLWVVTDPKNPEGSVLSITNLDSRLMDSSPTTANLAIPANRTGKLRTLHVVFSIDEGRTWSTWYPGWNGNGTVIQAS